jgi:hypothetical protein
VLGQVYKGVAHVQDPEDPTAPPLARAVAVKVIHPGIRRQIELDLDLMRFGGASFLLTPAVRGPLPVGPNPPPLDSLAGGEGGLPSLVEPAGVRRGVRGHHGHAARPPQGGGEEGREEWVMMRGAVASCRHLITWLRSTVLP